MTLWEDPTFAAAFLAYAAFVPVVVFVAYRYLRVFDGVRPTGVLLGLMVLMYYVDTWGFLADECDGEPVLAVRFLSVLALTFASVCGGYAVADRIIRPQRAMPPKWVMDRSAPPLGNAVVFWAVIIALAALTVRHMIAAHSLQALFQFASSEAEAVYLMDLREEVNAPGRGMYWAGLARFALLPPLALAAVSHGLERGRTSRLLVFSAPAALVLLSRLATLHKAPGVFWLLMVVLVWASRRGKARVSTIAIGGLMVAALIMSALYAFIYGEGLAEGWNLTVGRVTRVPQYTLLLYLRSFPDLIPHLMGRSISFVRYLSPGGPGMTSHEAVALAWHIRGTPNAGFMADGWADFSWAGVVAISMLVGLAVRSLESLVLRMPRTPLFHGCYFAIVLSVVNLTSVSFWTTLLTHGLGVGPMLVFAIWLFEKTGERGRARAYELRLAQLQKQRGSAGLSETRE